MTKGLVKQALLGSGLLRIAARLRDKGAAILMFHSVLEDPPSVADSLGGMIHRKDVFAAQMELLAREFCPVNLEQVARFATGELDLPHRAVAVTFDDGYVDNYEIAMPILDSVGVLATFYITVDCVENRRLPWPSRLRYAFRSTSRNSWKDESGRVWELGNAQSRERAYLAACDRIAQLAGEVQERLVLQMELDLNAKLATESGNLMMTWDQIAGLAQHGHIVGSHTMTHPNMAYLSVDEMRRELVESKRVMDARLKSNITHFSYPCPALSPNWSEKTTDESRRAGYETAVTTSSGLAYKNDNPLALRRVRPSKTVEGLRWNLETAFAGRAV